MLIVPEREIAGLMSREAAFDAVERVFAAMAAGLGIAPVSIIIPATIAASCAFMLPVATPPNAIVFGSGHIKQKEMMRIGMVLNLVCILVLTLFAWIFW